MRAASTTQLLLAKHGVLHKGLDGSHHWQAEETSKRTPPLCSFLQVLIET